jgi:hypothetical protein
MNPRFIQNLIKKHLLPAFPGFAGPHEGGFLAVPMNHLWRGFSFQKSSEVPMWYVSYNVLPLYMPIEFFHFGLGNRLRFHNRYFAEWYRKNLEPFGGSMDKPKPVTDTVGRWVWDEEKAQEVVGVLIDTLKSARTDFLDKLATPSEIATNGPKLFGMESWEYTEIFALSLIHAERFAEASPLLEDLLRKLEGHNYECNAWISRTEAMLKHLETNPLQAKAQLEAWERQTIKNLKLERFPN